MSPFSNGRSASPRHLHDTPEKRPISPQTTYHQCRFRNYQTYQIHVEQMVTGAQHAPRQSTGSGPQSEEVRMKRVLIRSAAALLLLAVLPAAAFAQASISGVVKDTSGAVLPGVTVEAASPVLIEKTRSTVTDGSGQYQIINLPPGTYTVTFTLSGFNVFKRDGIELSGSFVATLNADMRVGAIVETITVT